MFFYRVPRIYFCLLSLEATFQFHIILWVILKVICKDLVDVYTISPLIFWGYSENMPLNHMKSMCQQLKLHQNQIQHQVQKLQLLQESIHVVQGLVELKKEQQLINNITKFNFSYIFKYTKVKSLYLSIIKIDLNNLQLQ